jgi:hypothetical protein
MAAKPERHEPTVGELIGPPPNPDHDRSDPLPRPILEVHIGQSRAAAELSRQNPSPISPRAGFADFSRTFVEVSNDHREVADRPKRQSSRGGRDLTASEASDRLADFPWSFL